MSTDFRSCPSCKANVLADTYECPECGYAFDEKKSQQLTRTESSADLKSASMEEECRSCGAMVRVGLVRCWNCNAFMREDIARRYQQLTATPQKIIYSDIPAEKRTDFIPVRVAATARAKHGSGDSDNEFTLGGSVSTASAERAEGADFVLDNDLLSSAPSISVPDISVPQVVMPVSESSEKKAAAATTANSTAASKPAGEVAADSAAGPDAKGASSGSTTGAGRGPVSADADELLSIAMKEQEETGQRRGLLKGAKKKASGPRTQIIIPCPSCSTLVRASDEQAGKNVRCPNCKSAVPIPPIATPAAKLKKKAVKKVARTEVPKIDVTWINDAWMHAFSPASLVLKPGSMKEPHSKVDVAVTDTGLFILSYAKDASKPDSKKDIPKDKKVAAESEGGMLSFVRLKLLSLLGRGSSDAKHAADDLRDQWKTIREQVESTGEFINLPNADVITIARENLSQLKLVQPVVKAHESMFAGIPVFGEGRIAVYLPLEAEDGQQSFLSLPLSLFRKLSEKLTSQFGIELPATQNGVPEDDSPEMLSCFLENTSFESVRKLAYYQEDPTWQLEISGHRCTACGVTISEEGRAKKKLGGANGKGLAKTKCPKCSAKMGTDILYRLVSKPPAEEATPTPAVSATVAEE